MEAIVKQQERSAFMAQQARNIQRMYRAQLIRMFCDAFGDAAGANKQAARESAFYWFRLTNLHFLECCEQIGADPRKVLRAFARLQAMPADEARREVAEMRLKLHPEEENADE